MSSYAELFRTFISQTIGDQRRKRMTYFEIGVLIALALIYFSVEGAKTRLDLLQDIKDELNAQIRLTQSLTEKISIIERNVSGLEFEIRHHVSSIETHLFSIERNTNKNLGRDEVL
jgi:hypothetical protein